MILCAGRPLRQRPRPTAKSRTQALASARRRRRYFLGATTGSTTLCWKCMYSDIEQL